MNRREFLRHLLATGGLWVGWSLRPGWELPGAQASSPDEARKSSQKDYYRIVVLGDPHLPVRTREHPDGTDQDAILSAKHRLIDDVNSWSDVDEIVVLGDIAAQFGIKSEYDFAKQYFAQFNKPVYFINGNHDYVYEDELSPQGRLVHANSAGRRQKLARFQETFTLPELYYSREQGPYLFLFLSPDSLFSHYLTEISPRQIDWLRETLAKNRYKPTLVFFHAPLMGALRNYNHSVNTPDFVAQPAAEIHDILTNNSQIIVWASGHTHTPATNESYADYAVNLYDGHVLNLHHADMDRETIWTNSLYLYPAKIAIRTFNHKTRQWEERLDRTVPVPTCIP